MKFDFESARNAGVSDDEILDYISNVPSNADIGAFKKLGVSSSDIINLLSNSKDFQINLDPPTQEVPEAQPVPVPASPTQETQPVPETKSVQETKPMQEVPENHQKLPKETQSLEIAQPQPESLKPPTQNLQNLQNPNLQATQTQPEITQPEQPTSQALASTPAQELDLKEEATHEPANKELDLKEEATEEPANKEQAPKEQTKEEIPFWTKMLYELTDYDLSPDNQLTIQNSNEQARESELIKGLANKSPQELSKQDIALLDKSYKQALGNRLAPSNPKLEDKLKFVQAYLKNEEEIDSIVQNNLSYEELSPHQKELVQSRYSSWDLAKGMLHRDSSNFENFKKERKAKAITPQVYEDISKLNNVSKYKSLTSLIFGSSKEDQAKYLSDMDKIITGAGFDNMLIDPNKNEMYLIKDGVSYKLEDGFFSTLLDDIKSAKGEVSGGIAGAIGLGSVAASKTKNPYAIGVAGMLGGAIGSYGGAGIDYILNNWSLNRQNDNSELMHKMLEAGALSLVGDGVILGAGHYIVKPLAKKISQIPTYAKNLSEDIRSMNINAIPKVMESVGVSFEKAKEISENMAKYVETKTIADKDDTLLDKFFSNMNADILEKEKIAFDVAYSHPQLYEAIIAPAKENPQFAHFLHEVITDRASKIQLDPQVKLGDIQSAIKGYEQDLSKEYAESIDLFKQVLPEYKFFPKEFIDNKISKLQRYVGENKTEGTLAGIRNQLEDMQGGIDVGDMIDLRKLINSKLRNSKYSYNDKATLLDINRYIDDSLKVAIEKNVSDETIKDKLTTQWKSINARYAELAELKDSKLYKDIFDENYNTDKKLGNSFSKWLETEEKLSDTIIGKLNPYMQDKTQAYIVSQEVDKFIKSTSNGGEYVNWLALRDSLDLLDKKISNPSLKSYIETLRDMSNLFYNDTNIMQKIQHLDPETATGANGLSTNYAKKIHTAIVNSTFKKIQAFLPTNAGRNTAFAIHIEKALKQSRTSKDLMFELVSNPDTPPSLIKELKNEILAYTGRMGNALDNATQAVQKQAQQDYLDMLKSSQNFEKESYDNSRNSTPLEKMEGRGTSLLEGDGLRNGGDREYTSPIRDESGGIQNPSGRGDGTERGMEIGDERGARGGGDLRYRGGIRSGGETRSLQENLEDNPQRARGGGFLEDPNLASITQEDNKTTISLTSEPKATPTEVKPLAGNVLKTGYVSDDLSSISERVLYKVVSVDDIKPEFNAGSGTQHRYAHNQNMIQKIVSNFNPHLHFGNDGGFEGIPIVDYRGNIIAGNHRSEAIKQMYQKGNEKVYLDGLKEFFGEESTQGIAKPILVRELVSKDNEAIDRIAKVSNLGRENNLADRLITNEAKIKPYLDDIDHFGLLRSNTDMIERLSLQGLSAKDAGAGLLSLMDPKLAKSFNTYLKEKNDPEIFDILIDNAYLLYNIKKISQEHNMQGVDISNLMHIGIDYMRQFKNKSDRQALSDIIDEFTSHYLNEKGFQKSLSDSLKPPISDLKGALLGYTLKSLTKRADGGVNAFRLRFLKALEVAEKNSQPSLFNEGELQTQWDMLRYLLTDDRASIDEGFNVRALDITHENRLTALIEKEKELNQNQENPSKTLKEIAQDLEAKESQESIAKDSIQQEPMSEFGTNYQEYYHKGKEAIDKLLETRSGQVQGAFYKEGLGDIDLVWGDDKMGLKHILDKHPEVVDKIPEIIQNGEVIKDAHNIETIFLKQGNEDYRVGLTKGWFGKGDNRWVITAYENTKSPRPDSLPSNEIASKDGTNLPLNDLDSNSTTQALNNQEISNALSLEFKESYNQYPITSTKEFQKDTTSEPLPNLNDSGYGIALKKADSILEGDNPLALKWHDNYLKEFREKPFGVNFVSNDMFREKLQGKKALETLLKYKVGQVRKAFHKEGLGDIDLVWGDDKMGLKHILDKHPEVVDKIPEIIEKGRIIKNGGVETIVLDGDKNYRVGLSKGFDKKGDNHWVITAYEDTRLPHSDFLPSNGVASRDVLPSNNLEANSTTPNLKNQEASYENIGKLGKEDIAKLDKEVLARYVEKKPSAFAKYEDVSKKVRSFLEGKNELNFGHDEYRKLFEESGISQALRELDKTLQRLKENPTLDDAIEYYDSLIGLNHEIGLIQFIYDPFKQKIHLHPKIPTADNQTRARYLKHRLKNGELIVDESVLPKPYFIDFSKKSQTINEIDPDFSPLPKGLERIEEAPNETKEFNALGEPIHSLKLEDNKRIETTKEGNISITTTKDLNTNEETKQVSIEKISVEPRFASPLPSEVLPLSEASKLKNFTILDLDRKYGGAKSKFDNNVLAIKTLKELQASKAIPTQEQKEILNNYIGWGGLAKSFEENSKEYEVLKSLLSKEELDSARASSLSSFYTPYKVIDMMWKALEDMGFNGGRVLEPSMGIGSFFGLIPESLRGKVALEGIELDGISAYIAKYLYPDAKISHIGFENAPVVKESYNLVIGNPPYGDFRVYDKAYKEASKENIHNYFMLKNIDLLNDNGVMAQVITSRFLDNKNLRVKQALAKKAEFLGAIRLPSNTFSENANTSVMSDIVFFRKLSRDESPKDSSWINLEPMADPMGKGDMLINSYFVKNPSKVLGELGRYGGMYGEDTIGLKANGNTFKQLQDELNALSKNTIIKTTPILDTPSLEKKLYEVKPDIKVNSIYHTPEGFFRKTIDGNASKLEDLDLVGKTQEEFNDLTSIGKKQVQNRINTLKKMIPDILEIKSALDKLKVAQLNPNATEDFIENLRVNLNEVYDKFRKTHKRYLSDTMIETAFDGDSAYPHLRALEKDYKKNSEGYYSASKADIFTKRTQFPYIRPTKANSLDDAILISQNETGKLDLTRIASLLGDSSEQVKTALLEEKKAFLDHQNNLILKDEFLSGEIGKKINELQSLESLTPFQVESLRELRNALPTPLEIEDIHLNIGANYIPIEVYDEFAKEALGVEKSGLSYNKTLDSFNVNAKSSIEADSLYGVEGMFKKASASDVLEMALNNNIKDMGKRSNKAYQPDSKANKTLAYKISQIKKDFSNFVLGNPHLSNKVKESYNQIFNSYVSRSYDGKHLQFIGSSDLISLRPHQKNVIWRGVVSPTTLLDHSVGTGKTFSMIGIAMEARRLGIVHKPLFVVPNHIVNQFASDFARLYPDANILATQRFDKKFRQRTLTSITTGDYDGIIIGHSNFSMLPVSKHLEMDFLAEEMGVIEDVIAQAKASNDDKINIKRLEASLLNKQTQFKELADSRKDDTIGFEELGIDALFVDEAHEFKNLAFYTRNGNIRGLGNTLGSKKAFDLYMKTRFLRKNDKKIVFATGTPIANAVPELYTMQRYLGYENLKDKGLESFDQWAKTFGDITTQPELTPSGKYKLTSRFSGYVNVPELLNMYKDFADVILNEDVQAMLKAEGKELDLPKANFKKVIAERSEDQAEFMQSLIKRAEDIEAKRVEPYEDNHLKITTDGIKASLDMRIINPYMKDNPNSKVNLAVKNIYEEYQKHTGDKGTQLVFIDRNIPSSSKEKQEIKNLKAKADEGDENALKKLESKAGDMGVSAFVDSVLNSNFSVYEDIKAKLVKSGIPQKEIAFIHDFNTPTKKADLFKKVNSGEVRVLLGSTQRMGAGTNVQERLIAIHHIDAPWRPADLEQRNGRGIRQGNTLYAKYGKDKFKMNIYTYATKGMADSIFFEKLETKAKFIAQLRKGSKDRKLKDIDEEVLNLAELKAISTGDERFLKAFKLQEEIRELEAFKDSFDLANKRAKYEIGTLEHTIRELPPQIAKIKTDTQAFKNANPTIQIQNDVFVLGDKSTQEKLSRALDSVKLEHGGTSSVLYRYNDLLIEARLNKNALNYGNYDILAHSDKTDEEYLIATIKPSDFSPRGLLTRINNYFNKDKAGFLEQELLEAKKRLPKLKATLGEWEGQKDLDSKIKEFHRLQEEINASSQKATPDQASNKDNQANSSYAIGGGVLGGVGGSEQDNEDSEYSLLLGALGGAIGAKGLAYLLSKPSVLRNVMKHHFPDKAEVIDKAIPKEVQKEKRGIYNVAYNNKKATAIKEDLDSVDKAILFERGRHIKTDNARSKGYGANHIMARHSNPKEGGYVTQSELLNMGNSIREYLKEHKEPFIDHNGGRVYEWENKDGIRFRIVVGNRGNKGKGASTREATENQLPFPTHIITFYSDRNLNDKMQFRNPKLK